MASRRWTVFPSIFSVLKLPREWNTRRGSHNLLPHERRPASVKKKKKKIMKRTNVFFANNKNPAPLPGGRGGEWSITAAAAAGRYDRCACTITIITIITTALVQRIRRAIIYGARFAGLNEK